MADPPGNFQIMIIQYFVTGITMKPETRKVLVREAFKKKKKTGYFMTIC